jgi:FtsH-binding integral membrane protein
MDGVTHTIARLSAWAAQWSLALGALIVLGAMFRGVAYGARSTALQYGCLGSFVVVESVLFVPVLTRAAAEAPGAIRNASLLTLIAFTCGTVTAFALRRDLSFLRTLVQSGLGLGLIAVVTALAFDFGLGTGFALVMLFIASMALLHDVSAVLQDADEEDETEAAGARDLHAAASLALFASMALLFWSALSLFVSS